MSRGKEKVMKRTVRIMLTCLVLLLGITSAVPAQAAAKKKVSVLTQMVVDHVQEDEDGGYTYKLTYDKKGFIKKATAVRSNKSEKITYKFKYNKKKQITKQTAQPYFLGRKQPVCTAKYKYNKKGFLSKATIYEKNKKQGVYQFTWDSAGKLLTEKEYNGAGALIQQKTYEYFADGSLAKVTYTKSGGVVDAVSIYQAAGAGSNTYVENDGATGKTFMRGERTFAGGRLKAEAIERYDDSDGEEFANWYNLAEVTCKYKKIKTTSKTKVNKQQANILQYLYLGDYLFQNHTCDYMSPYLNY